MIDNRTERQIERIIEFLSKDKAFYRRSTRVTNYHWIEYETSKTFFPTRRIMDGLVENGALVRCGTIKSLELAYRAGLDCEIYVLSNKFKEV